MNSNINTNNFLLTAKKEWMFNKKQLIIAVLAIFGTDILMGALLGYNRYGGGFKECFFFLFIGSLFSTAFASMMFNSMRNKDGRIETLMLPASAAEKYLVRWIAVVPAIFILVVAAFYIGDLTRIATYLMTDSSASLNERYCQVIDPWKMISFGAPGSTGIMTAVFVLASYFLGQSLFIMGSILWPKFSFVKTMVVVWGIQLLLGIIIALIGKFCNIQIRISDEAQMWIVNGVMIAITLALYYLTYLRFKRSQVVYRLF